MAVRPRIILRPAGSAFSPIERAAVPARIAAKTSVRGLGIHQPREDPLGLLLPIRRQGDVVVRFHAGVNTKRALEPIQCGEKYNSGNERPRRLPENHIRLPESISFR